MNRFKISILRKLAIFVMLCLVFNSLAGVAAAELQTGGDVKDPNTLFLPYVINGGPVAHPPVTQCVDCPKNLSVMTGHSLRMDLNNLPHIAYGSDHLYHAWYDGSTWKYETVDSSPGVGTYASLAFDSTGKPGICYQDTYNRLLKFARWTGSAWSIATVDGPASGNTYPTLLFDSSDNPMVVYIADFGSTSSYQVKFARWSGVEWDIYPAVDTNTGYYPSLALDKDGEPHISYFRDDYSRSGGLIYASWTGSDWSQQIVDEDTYKGKDNSLAFDSTGKPHISYYDDWDGVKYARWNGSSWELEMIRTGVSVDTLGPTSLAFGPGDVPLVSVALGDGDTHLVWLYKRAPQGGWFNENLGEGRYTSLAVTPDGKPHISYFDYALGALRYASLTEWNPVPPYVWNNEILDYGSQVGQGVSLAMDLAGQPHLAYMDLTHNLLKYATLVNNAWAISLVDVPGIVPTHGHSIAIDPAGIPHIAYSDYAARKIMYASYNGASWTAEVVADDPAGGMDDLEKFISLAIHSNGIPHLTFFSQSENNLKHAYKPAASWIVEEVDKLDLGITGLYNSLALDLQGRPHISYQDNHNQRLMYAFWNGSSWNKMVADSEYTSGMNTSIAVDSANHPHICHSDLVGNYLKYTYFDGSAWSTTNLTPDTSDLPDNRQPVCSIKVSSGDQPILSYFDRASRNLMLVRRVGGAWVTATLDANGDNGEQNSLALFNGVPYIGYYGRSTKDLMFVKWQP